MSRDERLSAGDDAEPVTGPVDAFVPVPVTLSVASGGRHARAAASGRA